MILADIKTRLAGYRFTLAVRPLRRELVAMIERRVGQMADAEDIVQAALLRAWVKWCEAGREQFSAFPFWLRLVCFNEMKDRFRRMPAANDECFDPSLHGSAGGTEPSPLDVLLAEEQARAFERAVHQLPDELRHVLVMREIELMTPAQVAEALGVSEVNVWKRAQRAKARVLKEMGGV